jgi:hypothetical protein
MNESSLSDRAGEILRRNLKDREGAGEHSRLRMRWPAGMLSTSTTSASTDSLWACARLSLAAGLLSDETSHMKLNVPLALVWDGAQAE